MVAPVPGQGAPTINLNPAVPATPVAPAAPATPAPATPVVPAVPATPAPPAVQPAAQPQGTPQVDPKDIHARVAQLKTDQTAALPGAIDPYEVGGFNRADLDKITDPQARTYVENMAKSLESGFTKKFQGLAEQKKSLELQQTQNQAWTPERIQAALQDPNFVTAAQQVVGQRGGVQQTGLTENEMSTLTVSEKADLQKASQANNGVAALQQQLHTLQRKQEDTGLQDRYASYNAVDVDQIQNGLLSGQIQATREHLWKVVDYDNAVKRAYDLGQTDARGGITHSAQASSPTGVTVSSPGEVPAKEKTESNVEYYKRLAMLRLQQVQSARTTVTAQ